VGYSSNSTSSGYTVVGLNIGIDSISGTIPNAIGQLSGLTSLIIQGNLLHGIIPPEVGNLLQLKELSLYMNKLSGSIPLSIGNLTNLETLKLFQNKITGSIPSIIGSLTKLQTIDLSSNMLTNMIPTSLQQLSSLTLLDISINTIVGTVPTVLGALHNLQILGLEYTFLTGPVPSSLCGHSLKSIYVSTSTFEPLTCYAGCLSAAIHILAGRIGVCTDSPTSGESMTRTRKCPIAAVLSPLRLVQLCLPPYSLRLLLYVQIVRGYGLICGNYSTFSKSNKVSTYPPLLV